VETTRDSHEADVHFEVGDVRRGRLHRGMTIRSRRGEDAGQRHPLKKSSGIRVGRQNVLSNLIKASAAAPFLHHSGCLDVWVRERTTSVLLHRERLEGLDA
jgi:hypothetical protein